MGLPAEARGRGAIAVSRGSPMNEADTRKLSTVYKFLRNEGVSYAKCVKELGELLGKDENVIILCLVELQEVESNRKYKNKLRRVYGKSTRTAL
jgi:hypothetical protein